MTLRRSWKFHSSRTPRTDVRRWPSGATFRRRISRTGASATQSLQLVGPQRTGQLRGQVHGRGHSPLLLTARSMHLVQQARPQDKPYLWVIVSPTFDALVGSGTSGPGRWLVPTERPSSDCSVRRCDTPTSSMRWLTGCRAYLARAIRRTCMSPCRRTFDDEVRAALAEVPFAEEPELRHRWRVGRDVVPNDPPTFSIARPLVGGRFIRGASSSALVAFQGGKSSLALRAPDAFGVP